MAAHDWQLVRDLNLARASHNHKEVERLQALIEEGQQSCSHVPNPERPERCYKCGASTGPGLAKTTIAPEIKREVG